VSPGESLRLLRERKPLVHQLTNYVVMNETANATLALGALPVMAHAREEVEEMVGLAGALVLNIGTLSPHWVEAMLLAGRAATERGVPVVLDPVGAGATSYRTETAKRILDEVAVAVLRGNAGEVATLVGIEAEVRGVESIGVEGDPGELAREAARRLGLVASVTGAVDHVSDGARVIAIANGHPLLAAVSGTGCMSTAITGCFLAVAESPFDAAAEALVAFGVAGEDAARDAKGLVPCRPLRRARGARSGDARRACSGRGTQVTTRHVPGFAEA
jgi:hydroxyethylthiazole kinase